jgi:DeoR/GlpR family transcriptional regulator of sugar metabolism
MSRTLAISRHSDIMRRIDAVGSVSVSDLAEAFKVSRETVRRDLKVLADQGRVQIVHGGAARLDVVEPPLIQRLGDNSDGKAAIARVALDLVQDGATVLLDSGTTTGAIAAALTARRNLTIITNSLGHASILCRMEGNRVYALGGRVDSVDEASFGVDTVAQLALFRADVAFVACGGLAPDGTPTDYTREAAEFRANLFLQGAKAYLVADSDKFARPTPLRIANAEKAAGFIFDRRPPAGIIEGLRARSVPLIVAP